MNIKNSNPITIVDDDESAARHNVTFTIVDEDAAYADKVDGSSSSGISTSNNSSAGNTMVVPTNYKKNIAMNIDVYGLYMRNEPDKPFTIEGSKYQTILSSC